MNTEEVPKIRHPQWAEQAHVIYTDGRTCNCPKCVDMRGYFLYTQPRSKFKTPIIFKRQKP